MYGFFSIFKPSLNSTLLLSVAYIGTSSFSSSGSFSSSSSASAGAVLVKRLLLLAKTLGCPDAGAPNKDPVGAPKRPVPAELLNKLFEAGADELLPNKPPLG